MHQSGCIGLVILAACTPASQTTPSSLAAMLSVCTEVQVALAERGLPVQASKHVATPVASWQRLAWEGADKWLCINKPSQWRHESRSACSVHKMCCRKGPGNLNYLWKGTTRKCRAKTFLLKNGNFVVKKSPAMARYFFSAIQTVESEVMENMLEMASLYQKHHQGALVY